MNLSEGALGANFALERDAVMRSYRGPSTNKIHTHLRPRRRASLSQDIFVSIWLHRCVLAHRIGASYQ